MMLLLLPQLFSPSMKLTLSWWGGYPLKVSPRCINKDSLTEHCSYNRQVNRSSQLQWQDLSQYWLDKIKNTFSAILVIIFWDFLMFYQNKTSEANHNY